MTLVSWKEPRFKVLRYTIFTMMTRPCYWLSSIMRIFGNMIFPYYMAIYKCEKCNDKREIQVNSLEGRMMCANCCEFMRDV